MIFLSFISCLRIPIIIAVLFCCYYAIKYIKSKPVIVTNGENYAIRKGWKSHYYFDLVKKDYWWGESYAKDGQKNLCWDDKEIVIKIYKSLKNKNASKVNIKRCKELEK